MTNPINRMGKDKYTLALDVDVFLKRYWQKQPLLIRQAYNGFKNPISANELAGIACEPEVESRIIIKGSGRHNWQLRQGPFTAKDFKKLPASHWTLLVQGTNLWVPELQILLEDYFFLPQWRLEDIMTSFAVKQGSVGPHIDNYDVFLLQAEGRREWRISDTPLMEDDFIPNLQVKILKKFTADKSYILNPGDILYLPPHFAHYGIALDNCITHSIGLRAPRYQEILDDYFMHQTDAVDSQRFYSDPDLTKVKNLGEIEAKALNKVVDVVRSSIGNDIQIKRWFGGFITQSKYAGEIIGDNQKSITVVELRRRIKKGETLLKNPASRFAYIKDRSTIYFYAEGKEFILKPELKFAPALLCADADHWQKKLPQAIQNKHFAELLVKLIKLEHYCFLIPDEM